MNYSDAMTYEHIIKRMLERVPEGVDKREGSIIYDALAPAAAELAKLYIELDIIMDESFVDTASMQYLMKRCKERGVPIRGATVSTVQGQFTPAGLELSEGLRFNCDDQNFTIVEKIADGVYKLMAESPGTGGNLYSGTLLPIQYVDGLQVAEITGLLIPGEEADTADTLRKRYYESLDSLAFGGNQADYKAKVNLLDGVGGAKVYPAWDGGGTVRLAIITSTYEAPSTELIDQVQTAIDPVSNRGEGVGIAPIGHVVTVTGVAEAGINVASKITLATGWTWQDAESIIRSAINGYFLELASAWADEGFLIVRISQIENVILHLSCVLDVSDTTINEGVKNIQLGSDEIPALGSLAILGASE